MIADILKIIARDGYISYTQLAHELKTTQDMVERGIEQLLRMNYISETDGGEDCLTVCSNCPFAKNCSKEVVKTFSLAAKGKEYLKQ